MMTSRFFALLLAAQLVAAALPSRASADPIEDFYRGKTLTLLTYSSGGGNDVLARLIANYMRKYIPGNPVIVVKGMIGAAGIQEANFLYSNAPRDGTVFGTVNRGTAFTPLFGAANVQFDPLKFNWIGNATRDVQLGVSWKTSPVKTFQDAVKTELIVGATASDGETAQVPLILNATTGTKFKIVTGYRGGSEILLAMERGEINGRISWTYESLAATKPDWLANGNINVLFQSGTSPSPHLPNVPLALDFAKGPTERRILELLFTKLDLARPYTLPPGVPEERVAAMAKAFMSTMLDPEFIAEAAKLQIEISPVDGDQTRAIVERAVMSPPEVITRIREILGGGGG
jgi:tripartite-type tricarboxylate transporter receptor subunit TctC